MAATCGKADLFCAEPASGVVRLVPAESPEDDLQAAGDALDPLNWYEWESIRKALLRGESTAISVGDRLGLPRTPKGTYQAFRWSDAQIERASIEGRLVAMSEVGLVQVRRIPNGMGYWGTRYSLTPAGVASLRAAGPQKRESEPWPQWCGRLAFAVSAHHDVPAHAMWTAMAGPPVAARARLCTALVEAGFGPDRIRAHFGIPVKRIELALEHWKRLRGLGLV